MKKTVLVIFLVSSFTNFLDAQLKPWEYRTCNVITIDNCSPEEFNCLWEHSKKLTNAGMITAIGGISFVALGSFVYVLWGDFIEIGIGNILFWSGLFALPVGGTIWITGAARKSQLKKRSNYDTFLPGSLQISPAFGLDRFNNSQYYGLSLSLNF